MGCFNHYFISDTSLAFVVVVLSLAEGDDILFYKLLDGKVVRDGFMASEKNNG